MHRTGPIAFGSNPLDSMSVKIRDRNYGPERSANKALARLLPLNQTLLEAPLFAHLCSGLMPTLWKRRIKPFRWGVNGKGATLGDGCRLVGVALIGAAPFEGVDVKISRQSH